MDGDGGVADRLPLSNSLPELLARKEDGNGRDESGGKRPLSERIAKHKSIITEKRIMIWDPSLEVYRRNHKARIIAQVRNHRAPR